MDKAILKLLTTLISLIESFNKLSSYKATLLALIVIVVCVTVINHG